MITSLNISVSCMFEPARMIKTVKRMIEQKERLIGNRVHVPINFKQKKHKKF